MTKENNVEYERTMKLPLLFFYIDTIGYKKNEEEEEEDISLPMMNEEKTMKQTHNSKI